MKKLKNGSYTAILTVIVIVAVIIINLIVGQLPEAIREFDMSNTQIYTISDTSKNLLADLENDIILYVIADPSSLDSRIEKFVNRYAALSDKVKVELIDPILHPATVTELGGEKDSILVSCEQTGKTQTISFDDIIVQDLDYSSYYYYGTTSYTETEFDAEGQLTSAIATVTSEVSKKIYTLEGHNEYSLSTGASDLLKKNGMVVDSVNLLLDGGIPEDCDMLLCYAPGSDLSSDEYVQIMNYMSQGGNFMLIAGTQEKALPNFEKLLEAYGLQFANEQAYLADAQRYYANNPYYIFPMNKTSNEIMTGLTSDDVCLVVDATGLLELDDIPDGVTVSSFLTTSSEGVLVTQNSQDKGTYIIGASAVKEAVPEVITEDGSLVSGVEDANEKPTLDDSADSTEESTEDETIEESEEETADETENTDEDETVLSKLVVISAPSIISDQITDVSNLDVFMNAVSWNFDDVTVVSVEAKSLAVSYNTIYNGGVYSVVYIVIVPVALVVIGLFVWMRRRKR